MRLDVHRFGAHAAVATIVTGVALGLAFAPVARAQEKFTLGYSAGFLQDPFQVIQADKVISEAKAAGLKTLPVANAANDPGKQIVDFHNLISEGGLCQLSSLLEATFSGCGASYLGSFQNTKRDGCPAHVAKAPCSRGNVLAHARSRAEEVSEFVVTAAISSC